ncbi:MAG: antibiotic biosynthesis monooxygenase [Alphaproteobacteria bacterium]|nr:MAG: antibiotic biosynthesis monooxygenase [Alphaproteobacteria bacterium]
MIIVGGTLHAQADICDAFYAALKAGEERSRREDGCLFYHMAMSDRAAGIIIAFEGWRDQAALEAHLAQPEIAKLQKDFGGKFTADVKIYTVSDARAFGG